MTVAAQPNHPGSSTTQPDDAPSRVSAAESTEERPSAPSPVVDDLLLRDLSDLVYPHGRGASEAARIRAGADLTRESSAVRRLQAVWLHEGWRLAELRAQERTESRQSSCFEMDHEGRIAHYVSVLDGLQSWAIELGCPPEAAPLNWIQAEVAERQARAVDLAEQLDRTQEECARRGDARRRAERERNEVRAAHVVVAEALDGYREPNETFASAISRLRAEVDEADAIKADLRGQRAKYQGVVSDVARAVGAPAGLHVDDLAMHVKVAFLDAKGSALPVLPDVGPVERVNLGIRKALRCEVSVPDDAGLSAFVWPVTVIPYAAAAATKMLALLDAEAAGTSSDDEVSVEPAAVIRDYLMTTNVYGGYDDAPGVQRLAEGIAEALDAHRAARTSEEQA